MEPTGLMDRMVPPIRSLPSDQRRWMGQPEAGPPPEATATGGRLAFTLSALSMTLKTDNGERTATD
jgi:hypothetical protein